MTASDEQGELLHQAKIAAIAVIDLLKDGDDVVLLKLSEVPVDGASDIPSSQRNFSAMRNAINESSHHRSIVHLKTPFPFLLDCLPHLKTLIRKFISSLIFSPDHLSQKRAY